MVRYISIVLVLFFVGCVTPKDTSFSERNGIKIRCSTKNFEKNDTVVLLLCEIENTSYKRIVFQVRSFKIPKGEVIATKRYEVVDSFAVPLVTKGRKKNRSKPSSLTLILGGVSSLFINSALKNFGDEVSSYDLDNASNWIPLRKLNEELDSGQKAKALYALKLDRELVRGDSNEYILPSNVDICLASPEEECMKLVIFEAPENTRRRLGQ